MANQFDLEQQQHDRDLQFHRNRVNYMKVFFQLVMNLKNAAEQVKEVVYLLE